jgi:Lon-like ATP-dependent protease
MLEKIIALFKLFNIKSSDDLTYPEDLLDRIVGQEKAKKAMLKALKYNRHIILVGAPSVGKSAMSRAVSSK